jgi:hypothetical protein
MVLDAAQREDAYIIRRGDGAEYFLKMWHVTLNLPN